MKGSLDANVLLRVILGDIPEQRAQAIQLLNTGEFMVADTAVIEAFFVLGRNYGMTRKSATRVVGEFLGQSNIHCNYTLLTKTFPLYVAHPALSFEDCYLAAHAEHSKALPLYTFDQKLAHQLEGAALVC